MTMMTGTESGETGNLQRAGDVFRHYYLTCALMKGNVLTKLADVQG